MTRGIVRCCEGQRRRRAQQTAERAAEAARVVDGAGIGQVRAAQRGRQRRTAIANALLAGQPGAEMLGRAPVALGLEHACEQLLGRLAGLELVQLVVGARQHEARLQLQQRRDQHEELGGDLEIEVATSVEVVEVRDHDLGELDFEQVDLLAQHEREEQIEGTREDLEIQF